MAPMRKRTIKARLLRRGPDEEAFDREFWAALEGGNEG